MTHPKGRRRPRSIVLFGRLEGHPDTDQEVVITAVRKSEEEPEPERELTYRERALKLAREKAVPLMDLDALKTNIFESDEELEEASIRI